jgi:hypothetical protein
MVRPRLWERAVRDTLMARCVEASDLCVAACEGVLATDPSYTSPGTEPYSEAHLAMVSCASACSLLSRAMRAGEADLELVGWCAEICLQSSALPKPAGAHAAAWTLVVRACRRCARACQAVVERISVTARDVIDASRDTDFQPTLES